MKVFLITFLLVINGVFLGIKDKEVTYEENSIEYSALPNEFPDLLPFVYQLDPKYIPSIVAMSKVIGYLSYAEQMALLAPLNNSHSDDNKVFDFDEYIKNMEKANIFKIEAESLFNYTSDYEETLTYGLGCLKTASNKYVYNSDENQKIQQSIYDIIKRILDKHKEMNKCQVTFIQELEKVLIRRRAYFSNVTMKGKKTISDYFAINNNEEIVGFEYTKTEKESIVNAFEIFTECQSDFTKSLGKNAMEAEILFSNMDGCRDYKNPNDLAGSSSNKTQEPQINYRNKKVVGINDANKVRTDRKTLNGYLLNNGYGLGLSANNSVNMPFKGEALNKINEIWAKIDEINIETTKMKDKQNFTDTLNNINGKPFANLNTSKPVSINIIKNETLEFNNNSSSITYLEGIDSNTKEIFYDLIYNNSDSLSAISEDENLNIIKACFGVFTSGGKDDKDACRDVLKKKCGADFDYHCKRMGLYDYINSHPSGPLYPFFANEWKDKNDKEYFKWIENTFIGGTLVIKPSAIIGYTLLADSKKNIHLDNRQFHYQALKFPINDSSEVEGKKNNINVTAKEVSDFLDELINKSTEIDSFIQMDKNNYDLLTSDSFNLQYYSFFFFIFLFSIFEF